MYGIKIDRRKKRLFNDEIHECVEKNQLWVSEDECMYVEKKYALRFEKLIDAKMAITEKWEIVSHI